ncbi:uncharacterized protein NPIL_140391 [Nephila pilipes]|uniref:Uncharacterized protein n=1 Tax=Nephila pilipes TaxID=299642 RepID=A0A8X6U044_NEPPI|nr:uncharacterized protein NPIL_140391 [Nephila pilipes]
MIEKATQIGIHGFSGALERCVELLIYCRSSISTGETKARLVNGKFRELQVKNITILRLEWCATVLLSKLVKRVLAIIKLEIAVFLWNDSMIMLSQIPKDPMDLKTFVQNKADILSWGMDQHFYLIMFIQSRTYKPSI